MRGLQLMPYFLINSFQQATALWPDREGGEQFLEEIRTGFLKVTNLQNQAGL